MVRSLYPFTSGGIPDISVACDIVLCISVAFPTAFRAKMSYDIDTGEDSFPGRGSYPYMIWKKRR